MNCLERLKTQKAPIDDPPETTKIVSVVFVGTTTGYFKKFRSDAASSGAQHQHQIQVAGHTAQP